MVVGNSLEAYLIILKLRIKFDHEKSSLEALTGVEMEVKEKGVEYEDLQGLLSFEK